MGGELVCRLMDDHRWGIWERTQDTTAPMFAVCGVYLVEMVVVMFAVGCVEFAKWL